MSQLNKGIRAFVLKHSRIYDLFSNIVIKKNKRIDFVASYLLRNTSCKLLDVGCGTAKILEILPDSVDYTGIDLSEEYIQSAKAQYGDRGKFFCESVDALQAGEEKYDVILAEGLLHHLDDDSVSHLAQVSSRLISEQGRFISIDPVYVKGQSVTSKYLISKDRGQSVRDVKAYKSLVSTAFSNVTADVRHDLLRIPYSHLIMEMRNN